MVTDGVIRRMGHQKESYPSGLERPANGMVKGCGVIAFGSLHRRDDGRVVVWPDCTLGGFIHTPTGNGVMRRVPTAATREGKPLAKGSKWRRLRAPHKSTWAFFGGTRLLISVALPTPIVDSTGGWSPGLVGVHLYGGRTSRIQRT